MIVHEPHYEIAAQRGIDPDGLYVAWMWYGSPASKYGLRATRRILAINDQPVSSLDDLLAIVEPMNDREPVRVQMEGLDGSRRVDTLKLDLHYWPTLEIRREGERWVRRELNENAP